MNKLALVAAISCLFSPLASAQAKRAMTFQDLQAMKRVSDPQISPSGKWVMFSVTDVSLEKNSKVNHLWVVPLAGGAEKQLTFGDGESIGRFSPDGRMISLTMKDQIFEMPWNEAKGTVGKAIQVTNVDGGADGAIWSPDSKRLMFVASVYPECSDLGDWAKEDACDKAKDEAADKSPVKAMIFDHLLYRHWNAFTGEKRSHVLVVDSADGRGLRDLTPRSAVGDAETPTFSLGGPLGYAWAPDSKEIAYVTNLEVGFAKPGVWPQPGESTNNDVFTLRLDKPFAKAVKVSTSPGSDDGPAYSPDGKWLAWRSQKRNGFESDLFALAVYDRSAKTVRNLKLMVPEITSPPKKHPLDQWVDEFTWAPSSDAIYFASGSRGGEDIYNVDLLKDVVTDYSHWEKKDPIDGGDAPGEYGEIRLSSDGRWLVASRMSVHEPSKLILWDVLNAQYENDAAASKGLEERQLTTLNVELLNQLDLHPLEPFEFEGAAGKKVEGFIVKPPNFDPAKKYPVKFLMHGGPQTAWGDSWSYRWNWELLAADGYVVIGVNRRGSTGYGQKFVDEVSGDWGGKAFVDLMKGLDYAEATFPFIDKNRECALGASYGGFMANWVLTHTDRFKCIVTHDGLYNAESAFGSTEELWFNEWEFRPLAANGEVEQTKPAYPWDYFDKPTAENPFRKNSPMLYIKNARTPTLIIHSQKDYRLDLSEGLQLFTALQLRGVPSKMLYFPDEGHWVQKPRNSQLWYETVDDWCDRWLGMGKYKDVGPEKNPMAHSVAPHIGGSTK
ncbi:MAG TPA: S9 family peptidase [Acidobacteriaceae bacterium]|nr:S9 family peptidase [Acidobacteriaceae bacterium]